MGSQAILPATLPTPKQAKLNLRGAKRNVREKQNVADGMKARVDAAKDEVAAATVEVDAADGDLLDADEGTQQEKAADVRHHEACRRLERAIVDQDKVKGTRKLALGELREALRFLATARADLEAIREGRRKRD